MKRMLMLMACLSFLTAASAQVPYRPLARHPKKNLALKKPLILPGDGTNSLHERYPSSPFKEKSLLDAETQIGNTRYDLQTNQSTQNRIYHFDDNTISATWTFGLADPNFAERGSALNYFDGTSWGPEPTSRVEAVRAGWPSIFPVGTGGEGIISHDFATPGGILFNKRDVKGTGVWTQQYLPAITGQSGPSWPRAVTSGTDHNIIHVISVTRPTANSGTPYQGLDGAIVYTRSSDAGATWDIPWTILPGMTSGEYAGFGGDEYAFAEPKDNTVAFVVGDNWNDVMLMKSADNGTTWTKTVIFQHPYPFFKENTTLVLDTPWVCDGSLAVALDNQGKAHVFFGCMRVLNDDTTDGTTSYFPYSDGLAYWNENMPPLADLNPDVLFNNGNLVGWTQDVNGNDTIFEFVDLAIYYLSVTSMPSATVDEYDNVHVIYTSVVEGLDNGIQNYRHVYHRKGMNNAAWWSDAHDITGSIVHNFDECVFPCMAPSIPASDYLQIIYQKDEEPGLAVRGDEDPYGDNFIIHTTIWKLFEGIEDQDLLITKLAQNYPNPCRDRTQFELELKKPAHVVVEISSVIGQIIATQDAGNLPSGRNNIILDVSTLKPGIYFYTVKVGYASAAGKMMIE